MTVKTADVIIVGGGVHGASTAYELAKAGVKTVLFEKEYLSSGGSGRSAAGLRQHFGTEVNLRMAKYNLSVFPTLEEELDTGMKLEFTQWGYMWVAYSESCMDQLRKNVRLQQSLDIPSVMLTPAEIHERWPYLNLDGIIGAAFCGDDGHINPQTLTMAYGHAARRLGAEIKTYTPVAKLLAENGKIKGVVTESGEEWHAPKVLLSAGPWSTPLAATVGVELPVYPERHNILITEPVEVFDCPMVLCLDDGAYFKQCPNGTFMFGRDDQDEPHTVEAGNSAKFLEGAIEVERDVCAGNLQHGQRFEPLDRRSNDGGFLRFFFLLLVAGKGVLTLPYDQSVFNGREQLLHGNRLLKEGQSSEANGLNGVFDGAVSAHHDDRAVQ